MKKQRKYRIVLSILFAVILSLQIITQVSAENSDITNETSTEPVRETEIVEESEPIESEVHIPTEPEVTIPLESEIDLTEESDPEPSVEADDPNTNDQEVPSAESPINTEDIEKEEVVEEKKQQERAESKTEQFDVILTTTIETTNITSLRFEKTWVDVPLGDTPSVTIEVYGNGVLDRTVELTYPESVVEWKNLPLRDVDGNLIDYTIEEKDLIDYTPTGPTVIPSAIQEVYCEPSQRQIDWPIQNPTFVITRLTANVPGQQHNPFVIWTLNHVPPTERIQMLRNIIAVAKATGNDKQPLKDLERYLDNGGEYLIWFEGSNVHEDVLPLTPNKGQIDIDILFNADGTVQSSTLSFEGQSTWTHFAIGGYSSKVIQYTNTYDPSLIDIPVSKIWDDQGNQDGKRPYFIVVKLFADGVDTGETLNLYNNNGWSGTFSGLLENKNGIKIVYTISEVEVAEYESETLFDPQTGGYIITNSYTPETIEISGTKIWNDEENQDGKRPDRIIIRLHADGIEIDSVEITAEDDWIWSFANLPKYHQGIEITYSITEDAIPEYFTEYAGYNVINYYTPGKTSVSVQKVWDDADNQDGKRPVEVTVKLLADETDTGKTLVLNEANNWQGTFTDLDIYSSGTLIEYTIEEVDVGVEGYTSDITGDATTGFIVKNDYTPETIEIEGEKIWNDAENQDGKRPDKIIIRLLGNGNEFNFVEVTAADNWSWSFTNLPKYHQGLEISYSITEDAIPEYSTEYDGYNVENDYTPEKTSVSVQKVWDDAENQDGKRPVEVTVILLADGTDTGRTLVLNEANTWQGTFTDLDMYSSGTLIEYTIEEVDVGVAGYSSVITGDAITGFIVKNDYTPETIEIEGVKTWDDAENQDGIRPDQIVINLFKNGNKIASKTVAEKDNWSWKFEDLAKFEAGTEIKYTIDEDKVDGYTTEYDTYNVKNTHKPNVINIQVTKVWQDNADKEKARPDQVTIKLLANEVETGDELILKLDNKWTGSFENLAEYNKGKKVEYTIVEVEVKGYTSKITGDVTTGFTITNSKKPLETTQTTMPTETIKPVTPLTGESNILLIVGISLISVAIGLVVVRKRMKDSSKN
ncbi:MAG: Cna B-type domain-containing protein [Bacillota bacterium]|nr:Cna B-type domain-containing protein [Bacillota bacterium]